MSDLWNYIEGISAFVSAIGTIAITYYVYKFSKTDSQKENFFRHIIELYYEIEKDFTDLTEIENASDDSRLYSIISKKEQCIRRIRVNSSLMQYYVKKIPGYFDERWDFIGVLYEIYYNPCKLENHTLLSKKMDELCWGLKDKNKKKHTFSFDYDGKPIE